MFRPEGGRHLRKHFVSAAEIHAAPRGGKAGFTLLEILVAIIILSMVLTTVYAAYTGTFRIINETRHSDEVYGMARTALTRMSEDLASMCGYDGAFSFVSTTGESGEREFMNLSFLSLAHISFDNRGTSGAASISYTVTKESEDTGGILIRTDRLHSGDDESETHDSGGHILCNRLQSIIYTFYDEKGESFETWDSGSDSHKDRAPAIVSISLNFINPDNKDNPYAFVTKVYIPTAGVDDATESD